MVTASKEAIKVSSGNAWLTFSDGNRKANTSVGRVATSTGGEGTSYMDKE